MTPKIKKQNDHLHYDAVNKHTLFELEDSTVPLCSMKLHLISQKIPAEN